MPKGSPFCHLLLSSIFCHTSHSTSLSNPKTPASFFSTPVTYLLHNLGIGHVSLPPVFPSQLPLCLLAFNYFEKTHRLKLGGVLATYLMH